jgi:hypothetical protein
LLRVKNGVTPANLIIAAAAANVAEDLKITVWITSGTDGTHMVGSKHYESAALDFRTSNLSKEEVAKFISKLKVRLGEDYDVVLENDHIHVEKD